MHKSLAYLLAGLVSAALLVGCDASIRKNLLIRGGTENESTHQQRVVAVFDSYANKHGFSCATGDVSPAIKSCRAVGPRFLELYRSQSTFTVLLGQPYPGGLWSKAPSGYVAASEELEREFRCEFGDTVVVISR